MVVHLLTEKVKGITDDPIYVDNEYMRMRE